MTFILKALLFVLLHISAFLAEVIAILNNNKSKNSVAKSSTKTKTKLQGFGDAWREWARAWRDIANRIFG